MAFIDFKEYRPVVDELYQGAAGTEPTRATTPYVVSSESSEEVIRLHSHSLIREVYGGHGLVLLGRKRFEETRVDGVSVGAIYVVTNLISFNGFSVRTDGTVIETFATRESEKETFREAYLRLLPDTRALKSSNSYLKLLEGRVGIEASEELEGINPPFFSFVRAKFRTSPLAGRMYSSVDTRFVRPQNERLTL